MDANAHVPYSAYGNPSRPAILFLHGMRLGRDIWASHARALANDYHVITLDLPGHGSLKHAAFTPERTDELVDDVIQRYACNPPLIVGYSLGGYVTMHYASTHPHNTRALLLMGCTLDFESWKRWPFELSARLSQAIPEALLARALDATLRLTLPKTVAEMVSPIPFNRDVFTSTQRIARAEQRFSGKLARYQKPVLFVNGEYDFVFRLDERRFLKRIPQARLRIIRGADHNAPLRRVEEFTATVRAFAQKVF